MSVTAISVDTWYADPVPITTIWASGRGRSGRDRSPAAMDTEATVPAMVLTRLAPPSACWASVEVGLGRVDGGLVHRQLLRAGLLRWRGAPDPTPEPVVPSWSGSEPDDVAGTDDVVGVDVAAPDDDLLAIRLADSTRRPRGHSRPEATLLMSAVTVAWADVAWPRAWVHVAGRACS